MEGLVEGAQKKRERSGGVGGGGGAEVGEEEAGELVVEGEGCNIWRRKHYVCI